MFMEINIWAALWYPTDSTLSIITKEYYESNSQYSKGFDIVASQESKFG